MLKISLIRRCKKSIEISKGLSEAVNQERTDNAVTKRQTIQCPKDKQYNGQKTDNTVAKRQTIQWPKHRQYSGQNTDNTVAKKQTIQWPKHRNTVAKTDNPELKL